MVHVPVLLRPAIKGITESLSTNPAVILDATFGNGGYTSALLENLNVNVIALDRDKEAIDRAYKLKKSLGCGDRLIPIHGSFSQITQLLNSKFPDKKFPFLDGIVFDIGVSSNQLDDAKRGFSYKIDGPLDMRMCQSDEYLTAETIVNSKFIFTSSFIDFAEKDLFEIIKTYGQDRKANKISRSIVNARKKGNISSTVHLAEIIREATTGQSGHWPAGERHPAVRTFQALRIYINQELKELEEGLKAAQQCLKPKGRAAFITFHSLEDRVVKRFFQYNTGLHDPEWRKTSRKSTQHQDFGMHYQTFEPNLNNDAPFQTVNKKVIKPSTDEILINPRSRSAKLRIAERNVN